MIFLSALVDASLCREKELHKIMGACDKVGVTPWDIGACSNQAQ
jgi:hypothetical protein